MAELGLSSYPSETLFLDFFLGGGQLEFASSK